MKGKRRRSRKRSSNQQLPRAAQVVGFSEEEEAFFRAGAEQSEPSAAESFADLDEGHERPVSWLRRLFRRALPTRSPA